MTTLFYLLEHSAGLPVTDAWLSDAEAQWLEGPRSVKRIAEWRLGRWTAKRATRAALPGLGGLAPAAVEILAAEDGSPYVVVEGRQAAIALSLSHSSATAMCLVGPQRTRLGCDLERIEPRSEAFLESYLTGRERDSVLDGAPSEQPLMANLIWSAKESALKALRLGLRVDTRVAEVEVGSGTTDGWGVLTVETAGEVFAGRWRRQGDLVLTLVSDPEPGGLVELTAGPF